MPWSRHDLFFRRNAMAASRLTHRTTAVSFNLRAFAGVTATTACIAVATLGQAQNFTPIGPRYSGEVIISERIVSPAPERLPAPKESASRSLGRTQASGRTQAQPTLSIAGQEPVSLSDSAKRSAVDFASQTPIFALGNDVWKRMLDLERENADLKAELEYERKLGSYIERSEIHLMNQGEKIVELQEKLKKLQQEGIAKSREQERAQAQIRQLTGRNRDFELKVRDLQRDLRLATESRITTPEKNAQDSLSSRKVATKPAPQRLSKQRSANQGQPASERLPEKAERKQGPATLPVPGGQPVSEDLPGPIAMPAPVDMPAPEGAKLDGTKEPDGAKKPSEEKASEKKRNEKNANEQPKADKSQKPSKRGKSVRESNAMLEADEEPLGSVSLAVIPVGFEISDGLIKPIQESESEVNETETAPNADKGLQGGALGPLGKKDSLK